MLEKMDLRKYLIIGVAFIFLIGGLLFIKWNTGYVVMTGHAVYYGGPQEGQTTLMLQTAGSDNLGDAMVRGDLPNTNYGLDLSLEVKWGTPKRNSYTQFNISGIPSNQIIDDAKLCLYLYDDQGSQTIYAYHVYTDWEESIITWNNQPCGENIDNSTACNITAESFIVTDTTLSNTLQCWNITSMIKKQYNDNKNNVSIVLHTTDTGNADKFYSKEYSNSSLWPYLNITYHIANTAPIISIASPQNGATYGYNTGLALDFSVSDADGNLNSCWYSLNNGANVSLSGCTNTTIDAINGNNDLNIYANDSLGFVSSDSVSFNVQIGSPTIVLNSPIDSYLNNQAVIFSYTPTDIDLQACELWGNFAGIFSLNQTEGAPVSGSINTFNLNLNDGTYLWNIRCNDSVGNSAFNGNKTFYIDTVAPSISLTQPTGTKTSRTVSAIWSVSDTNLNNCWYNVYRGASIEISNTSVTCSDNTANFDVTVDANFVFNFYVNDSAGNSNNASSSFSVDTSIPSSLPSSGSSGGGGSGGGIILPNQTGKLQVSLIESIIATPGENKKIPLTVENIGKIFLNKCRLIVKGDIASWVYSTSVEGIAPGQSVDFVFNLNVPEEIMQEVNKGSLEVKCEEAINIQNVSVSIPKEFSLIEIKDIKQENNLLKISYVLDSSKFIGENIDVEIWLSSENGTELMRIIDKSPINRDGLIERNIEMQLPEGLEGGSYTISFAFSNELNNFIKKPIVLSITGKAVLDSEKGKFWVYILFLLILGVAIFFIWRRNNKAEKTEKQKDDVSYKFDRLLKKKK